MDQSKTFRTTEESYIDKNFTSRNGDGYNFAKVRVRTLRKPEFSSFCNGSTSLKSLNLEVGIATTRSKCDHTLGQETLHPGGLIELKGGNHSLTQGNRQSTMYGTHFAIGLLNRGVPREKIIV